MTKSAIVTICGRPNVGKSTLINAMIGEKIAIVSSKPQTTRNRVTGICTRGDTQIVFLDTPGFIRPRNKLGDYMVEVVRESVTDVDAVLFVVEPVAEIGPGEAALMEKLQTTEVPVILVINKIDTVTKDALLEVIANYSKAFPFCAVVPVSARTGDGVEILMEETEKFAAEGPHFFDDDMYTDQPERTICSELIREKILRNLEKEIPHGTAVEIEKFTERDDGIVEIEATIFCEKASHKGILIGKNGSMLRKIGSEAREDMENLLGTKVYLQTWVKVKENWRDSDVLLKNLGYTAD